MNALETLRTFDIHSIPDLDEVVIGALDLFSDAQLPDINLPYKHPLVVGSGNAEATGRILFADSDATFASESTYESKLSHVQSIDGVVVVSASGGKHAPLIAQNARAHGKPATLITNNIHAPASQFVSTEQVFVFPKNREPYTYNTSTYMGMILGATKEDPTAVREFIRAHVDTLQFPDFAQHDKFFLIVPPHLSGIVRMLQVKFIELFGRTVARDVETSEYMKHAVTVVPSNELFVSFGYTNDTWGEPGRRFNVPLPPGANYGAIMAVSYYVIGKIQKAHPPYFKENIEAYTNRISEIFGQTIRPIVE